MAKDEEEEQPRLSFREKLESRISQTDSFLCVGLDPHQNELQADSNNDDGGCPSCDAAFTFCKTIVDATADVAACYKPNAAFFEALGDGGIETLRRVCQDVIRPKGIPILLDVKRGDIGSTAAAYASACYDHIGADAVTLSPLMGWDSVSPFVTGKYADRGAFLLCKTSNPGSNEILNIQIHSPSSSNSNNNDATATLLYERIAHLVANDWQNQTPALLGLVVGATDPVALQRSRAAAPAAWILAPGVGAQGGDAAATVQAAAGQKLLVPVSRGISRAADPGVAARDVCATLREAVSNASSSTTTANAATQELLPRHKKEFLRFSLEQGVLKFGSFVLKSGRTSPYFFNAGLFASGKALYRLGKAYASTIMACPELVSSTDGVQFDIIFGPAYKGISLGAVVSSVLYSDFGVDVGFAYNRKEAKDHGEGGTLVGSPLKDKKVVILDDVITAGTAVRQAVELLQDTQATPFGVVIALDRDEVRSLEDKTSAVQAVARDLGIAVISIVSLKELQLFLEQESGYEADTLQSVVQYRNQYGAS